MMMMMMMMNSSQLVLVCKNTGACTVYSMPKAPLCEYVCACVCVCVCVCLCVCVFKIFSETNGPTEAKFHV